MLNLIYCLCMPFARHSRELDMNRGACKKCPRELFFFPAEVISRCRALPCFPQTCPICQNQPLILLFSLFFYFPSSLESRYRTRELEDGVGRGERPGVWDFLWWGAVAHGCLSEEQREQAHLCRGGIRFSVLSRRFHSLSTFFFCKEGNESLATISSFDVWICYCYESCHIHSYLASQFSLLFVREGTFRLIQWKAQ